MLGRLCILRRCTALREGYAMLICPARYGDQGCSSVISSNQRKESVWRHGLTPAIKPSASQAEKCTGITADREASKHAIAPFTLQSQPLLNPPLELRIPFPRDTFHGAPEQPRHHLVIIDVQRHAPADDAQRHHHLLGPCVGAGILLR